VRKKDTGPSPEVLKLRRDLDNARRALSGLKKGLGLDPNGVNRDGRTPLMGAAIKGRSEVIQLLVDRGAKLETRDRGSRDSEDVGSLIAGHTWQALDYADGLVRVGVQSAVAWPEAAALIRRLMTERGLTVPPPNRSIESICIVEICKERIWQ
jgi:hypothetical protein